MTPHIDPEDFDYLRIDEHSDPWPTWMIIVGIIIGIGALGFVLGYVTG